MLMRRKSESKDSDPIRIEYNEIRSDPIRIAQIKYESDPNPIGSDRIGFGLGSDSHTFSKLIMFIDHINVIDTFMTGLYCIYAK